MRGSDPLRAAEDADVAHDGLAGRRRSAPGPV